MAPNGAHTRISQKAQTTERPWEPGVSELARRGQSESSDSKIVFYSVQFVSLYMCFSSPTNGWSYLE